MAAYSANPNITPMDVMLAVMRDTHVALEMRVKMAFRLLPRLHRKLPLVNLCVLRAVKI